MSKIRVGVVRGGPSSEYAVSLNTGGHVLRNLDQEKYAPLDILLTTRGEWYMRGVRTDLAEIADNVDVIWNALHGYYGEDGKLQQSLEAFGIKYTGSAPLASAIGMNKELAKERFREAGMLTPKGATIAEASDPESAAFEIVRDMRLPLIVKPLLGGSSIAIKIVRNFDELAGAIATAKKHGDVLVEEYLEGKEATVCVLDAGTPNEHIVMYPIEIVPPETAPFFDFESKYDPLTQEICPGRFTLKNHTDLRDLATLAHQSVGARHYSRSDFIVTPKGIYILEINTLPGLTAESLIPRSLHKNGVTFPEFLDHVIGLAMAGK